MVAEGEYHQRGTRNVLKGSMMGRTEKWVRTLSQKVCLACGSDENITRDHVASRVMLKQHLDRDEYQQFSVESRDINIQPLCRDCNNEKGGDSIDYRGIEDRIGLLLLLDKWNLDIEVKAGMPYDSHKTVIRFCMLHGNQQHRTDDCPLFKDIPSLIEHVAQRVRDMELVERFL